jgi:hypothetical protein
MEQLARCRRLDDWRDHARDPHQEHLHHLEKGSPKNAISTGRIGIRGNNYEEKARPFLAVRGQVTHVTGMRIPMVLSKVGDNNELGAMITSDWNSIHLIIRGNVLMHLINGRLMSVTIDDDAAAG